MGGTPEDEREEGGRTDEHVASQLRGGALEPASGDARLLPPTWCKPHIAQPASCRSYLRGTRVVNGNRGWHCSHQVLVGRKRARSMRKRKRRCRF